MASAIIETGGKQYRVAPGDVIYIEKLPVDEGTEYTFDKVLAITGDNTVIGKPYVEGATVTGTIVKTAKAKKIIVYKMHPKKNYRRKQGHRQPYTKVQINTING